MKDREEVGKRHSSKEGNPKQKPDTRNKRCDTLEHTFGSSMK